MSDSEEQRRLAAIMFTDMVGYSALAQRNDKLALELLDEHRALLRFFLHWAWRYDESVGQIPQGFGTGFKALLATHILDEMNAAR